MKLTITALVFAAVILGMALGAKWFVWQECRATNHTWLYCLHVID